MPDIGDIVQYEDAGKGLVFSVFDPDTMVNEDHSNLDYQNGLTFTGIGLPEFVTVNKYDKDQFSIGIDPKNGDVGIYEITVQATDNYGASDQTTFTLTILNSNDPPIFETEDLYILEESTFSFQLEAFDPDPNDELVFSSLYGPDFAQGNVPDWINLTPDGLLSGTAMKIGLATCGCQLQ